ncbi:hypothetical protein RF11_03610 [Thelohanellus kitauei]|uniref:Uncharacterized protein n=1 Tax=Thelohanellus kitauei TaxID=669202 RepID=A0A0C2N9U9_THEKT|nr:hypothetical protein RF11_03610 [Thelohanellus kitauei]
MAELYLKDLPQAAYCYDESAECYRQIQSRQAYNSYRKSIEIYLTQGDIAPAINSSVVNGYIYEDEFKDVTKSKIFYDLADDLRRKNDIEHECIITHDYMVEFCCKVSDAFNTNIKDIYEIIYVEEEVLRSARSICAMCLRFKEIHSKYIKKLKDREGRERIDYIEKNHKKFSDEVLHRICSSDLFTDEKKKTAMEKINAIKI